MDPRETGKLKTNHSDLPQSVLSEMTLSLNRINKMTLKERAGLFASDPFKSLGFLGVRAVNLATVPDKETIETTVEKQRRELLTILKMPISEDARRTTIISFLTLPTRRDQAITLSRLSRSIDSDDRNKAKKIINQFQKDPQAAFIEMEK